MLSEISQKQLRTMRFRQAGCTAEAQRHRLQCGVPGGRGLGRGRHTVTGDGLALGGRHTVRVQTPRHRSARLEPGNLINQRRPNTLNNIF